MRTFRNRLGAALALLAISANGGAAEPARDYLHIVGSTTVYPFSSQVVEHFVKDRGFSKPMVQPTGSGGGIMLFCAGSGPLEPDITYASRRMRKSEYDTCQRNGVKDIVEIRIGYDGIVMAQARGAEPVALTTQDIYLALARDVPAGDDSHRFVSNSNVNWSDVREVLPGTPIRVMGPARTSGTASVFRRMAMEDGCRRFDWVKALKREEPQAYKTACRTLREDDAWIGGSEDDEKTVATLEADHEAMAVLSFGVLDKYPERLQAITVDGVEPGFDSIVDGRYPVARPLYLYVKKAHVGVYPGIPEFLDEFTGEAAWGRNGYLEKHGLVPMSDAERKRQRGIAKSLTPFSM